MIKAKWKRRYDLRVVYTASEFADMQKWLLEGDLATVSIDSETMGKEWFKQVKELAHASDIRRAVLLKELAKDTKEGLDCKRNHLAVVQMATADDRCVLIVMKDPVVAALTAGLLKFMLAMKAIVWLFHNSKFDLHQFKYHCGLVWDEIEQKIHDTQLCETLIQGARNYSKVNLQTVSNSYSEIPAYLRKDNMESQVSDWWSEPLTPRQIKYGAGDVLVLRWLYRLQKAILTGNRQLRVREMECRLAPRLIRIEETGAKYDKEKLFQFLMYAKERMNDRRDEYGSVFGDIKPTEAAKVLAKIKEYYRVTPTESKYDKKQGAFVIKESADKYALLAAGIYDEPAIRAYIELKELGNKVGWANKAIDDPAGRMFVDFFQLPVWGDDNDKDGGARTGRMSTSPQLQNLSNFLKQFIVADDGWTILSSDQGGVELRLMADRADCKALKWAFENGVSPHKTMCGKITGQPWEEVNKKSKEYRIAKEVNFGFTYGMGGPKFCTRVLRATKGEIRLTEAQGWDFRGKFFEQYPEIKYYHQRQHAFASLYGYVDTSSGRRRYYNEADRPQVDNQYKKFWDPYSGRWVKPENDSTACWRAADWKWMNIAKNMPIQGAGADITKEATIDIIDDFERLNRKVGHDVACMFAIVHDSNDSLVRTDYLDEALVIHERGIIRAMEKYIPSVPVEAEHSIGRCWAGMPDDGRGNGPVHSIRTEDYGCWVYPRHLNEEDLLKWMESEFQVEIKAKEAA